MRVPRTLLHACAIGATVVATLVPACAAHADPTPAQVASQIQQASNELEDVIEAYNAINEDLKRSQAATADLTARINTLQAQLDAAYGSIQTVASAAYRGSGGLSTLSVLLSAGSTNGLVDQVSTLQYVSRSQQREIDRYTALKNTLDNERKRYDTLIADQTNQQHQLAERKAKIEKNISDLEALKRRLNVPPPSAPSGTSTPPPNVSGAAGAAVSFAYAQLGKPYVYGAEGPNGYDCSGLTKAAWAKAGVTLPHNAAQQWNAIAHITRSSLQPGDLVFYRSLGHVAIYVGSGNVIHAPTTGDVVRVASVDMMAPYGYGRPG